MSPAGKNVRFDDLFAELERQGWRRKAQSGDGARFNCYPPDASKRMVVISSRSLEPGNAIVEVIRHLRHQGFVWPPPERRKPAAEPIVRSVPFEPKASPFVETRDREDEDDEPPASDAAPAKPTGETVFAELKEAKEYSDLAAADMRAAQAKADAAQKILEDATRVYREALADLKKARAAFDREFGVGGES